MLERERADPGIAHEIACSGSTLEQVDEEPQCRGPGGSTKALGVARSTCTNCSTAAVGVGGEKTRGWVSTRSASLRIAPTSTFTSTRTKVQVPSMTSSNAALLARSTPGRRPCPP